MANQQIAKMICSVCGKVIRKNEEADVDFDNEKGFSAMHMSCNEPASAEEIAREMHERAEHSIDFGEWA